MTDETTPVDGADPRDERIADLETQVFMLKAQVEQARPALVRDTISEAGFDPRSQEGRILQELSKNPDFRLDKDYVAARATELGFEPSTQTPYAANQPPVFEVPPGKVREQALREKNRELADAIAGMMPTPTVPDE